MRRREYTSLTTYLNDAVPLATGPCSLINLTPVLAARFGFQFGAGGVGLAHPGLDRRAHLLRQFVGDVPELVELAAGDHRPVEHLPDPGGQRSKGAEDSPDEAVVQRT